MNETEEGWLAQLTAAPRDPTVRLGYSNWLAANGRKAESRLMELSAEKETLRAKRSDFSGPGLRDEERSRFYTIADELLDLSQSVESSWTVRVDPELAIPTGLTKLGIEVANTIIRFLAEEGWTYSGDVKAFSAPTEWDLPKAMICGAVLVVLHAEGLLDECLGFVRGMEDRQERLVARLGKLGAWSELVDGSTSVINPDSYPGFSIGLDFPPSKKESNQQ
jgi:uncharacterized protein (TIGR02996 family)